MTAEEKKVEPVVEAIDEELLASKDKEEIIKMFIRLNEAKDYLQLMLMQLTVWSERNLKIIHELNAQLKMKDMRIETVIGELGRDKITLPDWMLLYSGDDYVHLWKDDDNKDKVDLKDKVKDDLDANAAKENESGA